jgi:hypothetical protein
MVGRNAVDAFGLAGALAAQLLETASEASSECRVCRLLAFGRLAVVVAAVRH